MENCNVNTDNLSLYDQQNQEVADFVLQQYFFNDWKKGSENKYNKGLELIISPRCNLGCKYCYIHRCRKDIFDENIYDEEATITNLDKVLKWLVANEYCPPLDIFSGELLGQNIGFKVLEHIVNFYSNVEPDLRPKEVTIPTNFTFLCNQEITNKVEALMQRFRDLGINIGLSASFDGKYMEQNRPFLHDLDIPLNAGNRDDEYYNKCFEFVKKQQCGLHPMIYSKNLDKWPQNWDWFQEQMTKYDIPWEGIYLLHVRNEEWTKEEIHQFQDFIRYLYAFIWEKVQHNPERLVHFVVKHGFNLLSQPFSTVGRGLTCGIQSQFTIRLSDLSSYPCHRLGYKHFIHGYFVDDDEKILRYKNTNAELLLAINSMHRHNLAFCDTCPINKCCTGPCLGANYEATQSLFTPPPTVCIASHALVATSVEQLKKYGAWNYLLAEYADDERREQLCRVEKEICHDTI